MAEEIRSELTFEAQQAINTLNRMQSELEQYNRAVTDAAAGTNQFNTAGGRFDRTASGIAGSLKQLGTAANTASKQLSGVADDRNQQAIQRFNQLFETSRDRIKRASDDVVRSFRNQEQGARSLGSVMETAGKKGAEAGKATLLSWQSVARIFAIQTIHRAITLVTDAFASGISDAVEYQRSLAEIQTIGDDLNLSMGELSSRVRQISDAFGQPIEAVAEGVYQTLSNQVGEASEAFGFLESANKLATAAVASTDDTVNLLSSAINSFNLNVEDSDDIAAKFFKTIELGRVRAGELANTFGRVGVLSNQLGVSFDETLASIASLTVQGLRFNEAFTLITNTQLKLIRPTDALKEAFAELGVESAEAGIQAFGFQGFLEELAATTGGTATDMGELFNRVRAIRGVLGLTGDAAQNFQKTLEEIQGATGEVELSDAFAKVFETDAARFQRELTALRNFFVVDFGQAAVATLVRVGDVFGGLADLISSLAIGLGVAGLAFVAYAAKVAIASVAMGTFTASVQFALLNLGAFLATPLGFFIAIGAAATAAAIAIDLFTESTREANEARLRASEATLREEQRAESIRRAGAAETEAAILSDVQKFLQKRQQAFREDAEVALKIQENLLDAIKDQVEGRVSAVESFVNRLEDSVKNAQQTIRELNGELQQVGDELDQFNFDESIEGLSKAQQSSAQLARSQETLRALQEAINKGDTERAERLATIAKRSAQAALSAAKEAGNTALVTRAREGVRDAIRAQGDIIKGTIADTKEEAATAQQLLGSETARLTRIKAIAAEIAKLEAISEGLEVDPEFSPDEARREAQKLTKAFEAELQGAAKSADLLAGLQVDFESIRNDLIAKFREPLTGVEIDLTDAVQINLERIIQKLNQQASQLSTSQTAALASLGVDTDELFRGFGEAQKLVTEIPKEIQRGVEATKTLNVNAAEFNQAMIDADSSLSDVVNTLERAQRLAFAGAAGEQTGFLGFLQEGLGSVGANLRALIPGLDGVRGGAANLSAEIEGLVLQFRTAFAQEDAQGMAQAISGINTVAKALAEQGLNESAKAVDRLGKDLGRAFDEAREAKIGEGAAASLRPLEERIRTVDGAFQETVSTAQEVGTAAGQGASGVQTAESSKQTAIQQTNRALEEQIRLQRESGGAGGGTQRQFGGLLFRADGGMIFDRRQFGGQRGTDSIPTLLTAGESVNTLDATRRFFPQIQAMNAGVIPQFREEGGVVNNNVGDISISVTETASSRDTAREVMKQIKREFRRDTFSLGRVK